MTHRISRDRSSSAREEHLRAGDVLGGKYRIEHELGRGGMGIVYAVSHLEMPGARFAIKWLHTFADEKDVQRFRREARISGAIRHRNVIEVYDVNIDQHGAYMVMELLEGETLASRIARGRGLFAPQACRIIVQCLAGLAAAHAAGVIHRDIKPENIFLCARPEDAEVHPKVLDFGVSRVRAGFAAKDTTLTHGGLIGTPAYMAPEQLHAQACDSRTDVYAMGATLYEALAGVRPFSAASYGELVVRIVTGDVKPLHEAVAGLSPGLSEVVMRAMATKPDDRYASAAHFAAALAPYVQPLAAVDAVAAPLRSARTRWPLLALSAGVAAAVATAWLLAGTGRGSDSRTRTDASHDVARAPHADEPVVQPVAAPDVRQPLAPDLPSAPELVSAEDAPLVPVESLTSEKKQSEPSPRTAARRASDRKAEAADNSKPKREVRVPPPGETLQPSPAETPVQVNEQADQPARGHGEGLQPRPRLELKSL